MNTLSIFKLQFNLSSFDRILLFIDKCFHWKRFSPTQLNLEFFNEAVKLLAVI